MPTRDPEVGATGQVEMVVGQDDLASTLSPISGDAYPAVFATTRAIALCELAAGRILAQILYDVSPSDPFALFASSLMLAVAALLACFLPARRATYVNPITALRTE